MTPNEKENEMHLYPEDSAIILDNVVGLLCCGRLCLSVAEGICESDGEYDRASDAIDNAISVVDEWAARLRKETADA